MDTDLDMVWLVEDIGSLLLGASVVTTSVLADFSIATGTQEALGLALVVASGYSLYSKYT